MRSNTVTALALLGGTLWAAGCRDKDVPVPDPCRGSKANPLAFRFLESWGNTPTPDTAFTEESITFDGPGAPYTRYEWQVGTDPRPFTQRRFALHFPETAVGRVAVRLIATRPPNRGCFPNDDGVDTLTKTLTLMSWTRARFRAPIYGKFRGSNVGAPNDTFTVRIFSAPDYRYPNDPAAAPYDYLRNLDRGCQAPRFAISTAWSGIYFNFQQIEYGCFGESGTGYLTTRDSIRIDYSRYVSDRVLDRVNRVFRGKRVR